MSAQHRRAAGGGRFRIIGGEWRRRRLAFDEGLGIRPSPDRVRETLFNWLQPVIGGARCLDLYAGSGALGLEALSRGAASCVFVDRQAAALERIDEHLALLACDRGRTHWGAADAFLAACGETFDVVFVDPPFADSDPAAVCERLEDSRCLAAAARIYVECPAGVGAPALPPAWELARSRRAGRVGYHLAIRQPADAGGP